MRLVGGINTRDFSYRVYRGIVKNVEDFPASETVAGDAMAHHDPGLRAQFNAGLIVPRGVLTIRGI
jgi:hypothetical protein